MKRNIIAPTVLTQFKIDMLKKLPKNSRLGFIKKTAKPSFELYQKHVLN